jgi:deoxyadenosine/deoxycytidine kinase
MTTVINLFGGSGIGKSTTAAHLFAEMKYRGIHCELVREYVKMWAWEKKPVGPFDQMYLLGKQSKYESMLYGKVDYIVTDSPLLLCPIYERYYSGKDCVAPAAVNFLEDAKSKGVTHLNFLLKRFDQFDERGRFETKEQAIEVDSVMKDYLTKHNVPFHELSVSDRTRVDEILNIIFPKSN